MIIIGYPGIGKSTLAGKLNCIDLESSLFNNSNGNKYSDWTDYYCKIADDLSKQGYNVFISSHSLVRTKIKKISKEKIICIIPSMTLKDEWINRLKKRAERTKLDKDIRAYIYVKSNFENNISEMRSSGFNYYIIKDMNYKLEKIIKDIVDKK